MDGNVDGDGDADADADGDGDADGDADVDADVDGDGDVDADADADGNVDGNVDGDVPMTLCLGPHPSSLGMLCSLEAGHEGDHRLPSPGNGTGIVWSRADAAEARIGHEKGDDVSTPLDHLQVELDIAALACGSAAEESYPAPLSDIVTRPLATDAALRAQSWPRWRSVGEEPPQGEGPVLIWDRCGLSTVPREAIGKWLLGVTHWMPLPPPPEGSP